MSTQTRGTYRIYLLSVWRDSGEHWRFVLEDPQTGDRRGYLSIEALAAGIAETIEQTLSLTDEQIDSEDSA